MFKIIEYDDYLGWRLKSNLYERVSLVDVENIPVKTNRDGFWDREFSKEKLTEKCRIAFLGDSFAWGFGVHPEERFSNLIERANAEWESFNFGVPGYGTDQELLLWREQVYQYQPNLVVLTVYQNDYIDNLSSVRYGRQKPYFELDKGERLILRNTPVDPDNFWNNGIFSEVAPSYAHFFKKPVQRRSRIVHWLVKNSDLVRLFYTLVRDTGGIKAGRVLDDRRQSGLSLDQETALRLSCLLVAQLAEEVQRGGGHFLVIFSGNLVPQHLKLMRKLENEGISYVDATTKAIAEEFPDPSKQVYYAYSKHWTPAAHQVVAALLAKKIRDEKLCMN